MTGEAPQYSPEFKEIEISPQHADMDPDLLAAAATLKEAGATEESASVMKVVGDKASGEYKEKEAARKEEIDDIQKSYMAFALSGEATKHWDAERIAKDALSLSELNSYSPFFTEYAKKTLGSNERNDFTEMYGANLFMSMIPDTLAVVEFCKENGIDIQTAGPKDLTDAGFEPKDSDGFSRGYPLGLAREYYKSQNPVKRVALRGE